MGGLLAASWRGFSDAGIMRESRGKDKLSNGASLPGCDGVCEGEDASPTRSDRDPSAPQTDSESESICCTQDDIPQSNPYGLTHTQDCFSPQPG